MAENPFIFGKVVRGEHFCDREDEIDKIKKMVDSKQHMVVISPRRYGKTSLVINALEKNRIPYMYVDCSFIEDEKGMVTVIINDYAKKLDNIALIEKFLKRFDISFSITINPISVTISQITSDSLKSLLTEVGKNYIIVFDEFQDVYGKDRKLVNKIRSIVQFLERSVIMLGSKRHLLNSMFLKPRGIFYNFGYALHLDKIEKARFKKFIAHWFAKNKIGLGDEEIDKILAISECHPFFTQYFCHFLFERRLTGKTKVDDVVRDILEMNSIFYDETYRSLPPSQRKALHLLSYGRTDVYSADLLKKFGITSSQALQKALRSLVKKEIVDKNGNYHILDIFFKHWLYQMVLNQKV
ncbi:MAG: ATP-binding protein [Candidatus Micrarchaeota archaeon]